MYAGFKQGFDVLGRGGKIEALIVAELRRHRGIDAVPAGRKFSHGRSLLDCGSLVDIVRSVRIMFLYAMSRMGQEVFRDGRENLAANSGYRLPHGGGADAGGCRGRPRVWVADRWPSAGSGSASTSTTFRSAVVNEPRGSDVMVGALLVEPIDPTCAAGVIFFNNVGYLGMCGHGTIGVAVALAHLGRIRAGHTSAGDARRPRRLSSIDGPIA